LRKIITISIILLLVLIANKNAIAQEMIAPLKYNQVLFNVQKNSTLKAKKSRATLPFIDDFSYDGPYPDPTYWTDKQAFINNTMSANPITRGIATLDGLNEFGRPYFKNPSSIGYADSLTSQPIDLSSYATTSNIFLSFFYQPQGLGFAPESNDSLMLFFKNNQNEWIKIWRIRGSNIQGFRYVTLPMSDAQFLHANFQFRFVNIASLDINNDTWNIDYVKIDANRSFLDSINNDVAFTTQPTSILYPYSSLPYRHFIANQANEKSGSHTAYLHNLYPSNQNISLKCISTELQSATNLNTATMPTSIANAYSNSSYNFNTYNVSYVPPNNYSKTIVQNKYYFNRVSTIDRQENDTITSQVVFDNYFAYDDGSAEKSYFLMPAFNFAAKTALEFTLNEADSVRGMMVNFGPQLPTGAGKLFSMVLYKTLAGNGLNDSIIMQKDLNSLMYENVINGFTSYAFDTPILLNAGKYYIGITQPANFGSDSIYYGLDVNNNTNIQKLSYNIDGTWANSLTPGCVMIRPIVGQVFTPTNTFNTEIKKNNLKLFPNPVQHTLYFESKHNIKNIKLFSIAGQLLLDKNIENNQVDLSEIQKGLYLVELTDELNNKIYQKINKD
jgi:hypothetical protein